MAIQTGDYPAGQNRIFYKATGFATGLTVTGFIWSPEGTMSGEISLAEHEHGVYSFEYTFTAVGQIYAGVFLEDGTLAAFHTFRIVGRLR